MDASTISGRYESQRDLSVTSRSVPLIDEVHRRLQSGWAAVIVATLGTGPLIAPQAVAGLVAVQS
jgi:hypothetical protein